MVVGLDLEDGLVQADLLGTLLSVNFIYF